MFPRAITGERGVKEVIVPSFKLDIASSQSTWSNEGCKLSDFKNFSAHCSPHEHQLIVITINAEDRMYPTWFILSWLLVQLQDSQEGLLKSWFLMLLATRTLNFFDWFTRRIDRANLPFALSCLIIRYYFWKMSTISFNCMLHRRMHSEVQNIHAVYKDVSWEWNDTATKAVFFKLRRRTLVYRAVILPFLKNLSFQLEIAILSTWHAKRLLQN